MGYNARNDEIRDNVTRMRREWEAQSGALATVRGQPVVDVPGAANPIELRSCHLGSAVAELALMEPSESGRASARVF